VRADHQAIVERATFDTDRFRVAVGTSLDHLQKAKDNAARLLTRAESGSYGRLIARRLNFLETCLRRAKEAHSHGDRIQALEFCLEEIVETRTLLAAIATRRQALERFANYMRLVFATMRAMLTAALRLARHRVKTENRLPLKSQPTESRVRG
jgi:hypothetical protein